MGPRASTVPGALFFREVAARIVAFWTRRLAATLWVPVGFSRTQRPGGRALPSAGEDDEAARSSGDLRDRRIDSLRLQGGGLCARRPGRKPLPDGRTVGERRSGPRAAPVAAPDQPERRSRGEAARGRRRGARYGAAGALRDGIPPHRDEQHRLPPRRGLPAPRLGAR